MKRREYLAAVGAAAGTALAGCVGGSTGTLATQVTDQPGDIGDFESCVVTITELRVLKGSADEDDGTATEADQTPEGTETVEGEQVYEVADAEADLVQLQDGNTELIDEREFETGEYQYLKLLVSNVDATLENGEDVEVRTPGNAPLKFNAAFEIREDTRTVFTADFTPVRQGRRNRYILQPVADGTDVSYEE